MQNYKAELASQGYCIIPNVLTSDEIDTAKTMFKEWQKTIDDHDKIHRAIDPHGIYKHHEVGHQRHAWYIRTNPKVQEAFKSIWNCDDLIVSFDGSCYIDKNNKQKDKIWTHTDQGPDNDTQCYQGFVALTSNVERTLIVYESSHLYHKKYFEEKGGKSKSNWHLIDHDILDNLKHTKRALEVPAGSLVIWDSRCFHQNRYGAPESEERMVQYVCYFPRNHKHNTLAIHKKRQKYFEERRTTSHWPAPVKVNGKQGRTYGNDSILIDYSKLKVPVLDDMMSEIQKLI